MRLRLFALCLSGLAVLPAGAEDEIADRILTGGRILTVDSEDRVVEAIAIRKGRILATGTTAEIDVVACRMRQAVAQCRRCCRKADISWSAEVHLSVYQCRAELVPRTWRAPL